MPLWLPAAIAGASSALGAWQQNRSQQGSADKQMQFQQQMSDTAYQRATADMRASGINPMLAYMQGGASSPGGAAAQMSDVIGPAVASAQHQRRLSSELDLMGAQRAQTIEGTNKLVAETSAVRQSEAESRARQANYEAQTRNIGADFNKHDFWSNIFGTGTGATRWNFRPQPGSPAAKVAKGFGAYKAWTERFGEYVNSGRWLGGMHGRPRKGKR